MALTIESILSPAPIFRGEATLDDAVAGVDYKDFAGLVDQFYDTIEEIIIKADDTAAVFVPEDPALQNAEESGWTLGHVIVHLTAGLEEASVTAALLASGVTIEGRLRYETPWETIQSAQQVRQRLVESRRMVQSYLKAWPDAPHFTNTQQPIPRLAPINCLGRLMLGLMHTKSHLDQLREIMRQAESLQPA